MANKQFYAHIYNTAGTYVNLLYDIPEPQFTESLNGGCGSLALQLPYKFDDYGKGETLDYGYRIELFVAYNLYPTGRKIYSGRIDKINASVSKAENVTIEASGYIHQLALDMLEYSNNTVFKEFTSQEISTTIKNIIDQYKSNRTDDVVTYSSASIADTGKSRVSKYYLTTPLQAILSVLDMADPDWFFFIDADNVFYFQEISTTPDHIFTLGSDVVSLSTNGDIREARDNLMFSNGLTKDDPKYLLKRYTASSAYVQRQFEFKRDGRFVEAGANEYGARFVDIRKDGFNQTKLRVTGYESGGGIETIKPGDTFALNNYTGDTNISDNSLIVSIDRTIDYIDITAEDAETYINRELLERKNAYDLIAFDDNLPKVYTI